MGEVVRAYDPKLRREVALKRVIPSLLGAGGEARLVREAQAMARLSHPNVVAVYDVEVDTAAVTLVMELVPGVTLKMWGKRGRGWQEILEVFWQAGRGLLAAHEAGLVHRDFKPGNVLISRSARSTSQADAWVKVTDFGVAKVAGESGSSSASGPLRDSDMTDAGSVMGTPRYMAPEQYDGRSIDARADQYAFCVALWESLHGVPPFEGTPDEVTASKRRGPPRWPGGPVPAAVADAIVRGLAPDPRDRFPSMRELLELLRPETGQGSRRFVGIGLMAIFAVGAGVWAWQNERPQPCRGAQARLAGIWGAPERAKVQAGLSSLELPYASAVWESLSPELDAYADAWRHEHVEACEATTVRGEQSEAVMDLRMACLERARAGLGATVRILENPDEKVLRRAMDVVRALPRLSQCSDVDALLAEVPPPTDSSLAVEVEDARATVAAARVSTLAGRYDDTLEALDGLRSASAAEAYPPLAAEVDSARGEALSKMARYEDAEEVLRRSLSEAVTWGMTRVAAQSASTLAYALGGKLARYSEARIFADLAQSFAERLGDPWVEADARSSAGAIATAQGEYAAAEALHRQALRLQEEALGPGDPRLAPAHANIGSLLHAQGKYPEAEAELREALRLHEAGYVGDHPDVASAHINLGASLGDQGDVEGAEREFRAALAIFERALGPDHPDVGVTYNNLGLVLHIQGKPDEAEAAFRRAIEIEERAFGDEHPEVAMTHDNLGNALTDLERWDEARVEYEHALALRLKTLGPEHPDVALSYNNLGNLRDMAGDHVVAEGDHRKALAIREKSLDEHHPLRAMSLDNIADALVAQGRLEEAKDYYEQAWAIRGSINTLPRDVGDTAFELAKVLWTLGVDRKRAIELAKRARQAFESRPEAMREQLAEVKAWLRQNRSP
jgi:serine/threonine-protein kinase